MRFTRIIAGTITAGLVGLVPVTMSSSADAAATLNLTTTTTLEVSYGDNPLTYGDEINLEGAVVGSDTSSVYEGTVQLMAATPSAPTPVPVGAPVAASGYLSFSDLKPATNTAYTLVYSGYAATSTYENNYAASASVPLAVGVTYKLKAKTPGTSIVGKIKPSYAKKKVLIERKVGKKYKKYKTVKTDKKSSFRVKLPTGKRGTKIYFRVILKGSADYQPLAAGFYTIAY